MVNRHLRFLLIASSVLGGSPLVATEPVSFELDVQPILSSHGCNAGACHGKQRGQNGFQLSLLGFDPDYDFAALTQHARGRRVFPAAPEQSLVLRKATAQSPHGGGRRLEVGDSDYEVIRRWIAGGMPCWFVPVCIKLAKYLSY